MKGQFRYIATLILLTFGHTVYGQDTTITFSNALNAYYSKAKPMDTRRFFETKINEITLNPDATFEFFSRPNVSCFTWHSYKGTWKKNNDTLVFNDSYEVKENDTRATYKKDSRKEFVIDFRTDNNSSLKNRNIEIQYEYDYDAHLSCPEKSFSLDTDNTIIIPYGDIPNLEKLAAIRVEYLLDYTEKRYTYLTENKTVNIKQGDIPNIMSVEFIEKPKKEIVNRTIRAVVKNNVLTIISSSKTKTILPDYYPDIEFENSYTIDK